MARTGTTPAGTRPGSEFSYFTPTSAVRTRTVGGGSASDASITLLLLRSFIVRRVLSRFLLMLFIIWLGATIMFVVPRQFGINPSNASLFTPSPEVQRVREMEAQLQDEYETLSGEYDSDGEIDGLEAERLRLLEGLISENERRSVRTAFERQFEFGEPQIVQYRNYIFALATFDLGASQRFFPVPVFSVIRGSLYWTLGLTGVATVIAFTLGTLAGGVMGWGRSHHALRWMAAPLIGASSVPYYLLGWILIWFLAFRWGLFPLNGGWDNFNPSLSPGWNVPFILSALHHSVLPALSIIIVTTGFWTVSMRGLVVNMHGEDYIVFAESKGLRERRIFLRYVLRNALLPQITGLAATVGSLLTGVLLVELVFRYPGIGFLFWQAVRQRDVTMMTGLAFIVIVLLAVAMFLLDLLLPLLDRRIRDRPA